MLHYVLILYFWSYDHVARLDVHNNSYEMCLEAAEKLSENTATSWVCIPEGK